MIAGDFTIQLYSTKKTYNETLQKIEWKRAYTLLTTYINGQGNPGGTYDENLSAKNNSQYSLTFSISKIVEERINPLFYMIVENRRLRLTSIDYTIDFIITAITPQVTKNNVIYNVTCQDVFSYDWSKQNIKISYNSLDEYNKALYINQHAKNILVKSKQEGRYMIDPDLETKEFADFPNMLTTSMIQWTERTSSTLELSDTTPFSAMVELANKYGAALIITYPYSNANKNNEKTIIGFKNQQTIPFKGLYVRPEVNLSNFSVSRKTDNFCSILWVEGSEDADGNIVSLMPDMPQEIENFIVSLEAAKIDWRNWDTTTLKQSFYNSSSSVMDPVAVSNYFSVLDRVVKGGGNFLYDFNYYYNNGLMSKDILKRMNDIFSIDLRSANLLTAAYTKQYNRLYSELILLETEVEDYISNIAAEEDYREQLLKDKKVANFAQLTSADLANYNSSISTMNDIMFDDSDEKTSSLDKIWKKDGNSQSKYINNGESIYGSYFINNKIVNLKNKKSEIEDKYKDLMKEAYQLESKYNKNDEGITDWNDIGKKKIVDEEGNIIEVPNYSIENNNPDYIQYCYLISQAEDIYPHVGPYSYSDSDFTINITKRGYYQVFIEELEKLLEYRIKDIAEGDKNKYYNFSDETRILGQDNSPTLIINLLTSAQKLRDEKWNEIYKDYGDFICEASYSDSSQVSGDALYLVAQKEFTSRCNPSVDYSATIIDLHKVLNVLNSKIEIGDIIYFYNKDLYNQYNGNIVIEVPHIRNASSVTICNLEFEVDSDNNINSNYKTFSYPISSTNYSDEILSIYIKVDDQIVANNLILSSAIFKVDGEEVHILNKYLDMKQKPIQLQITGITKKLRDATTQLTVSTNRMVENLLGKILRRIG